MTEVEKITDRLPPKDEFDPLESSEEMIKLAALHDLREIGVLANGQPVNGEQTWYLTEAGVAWAEGEIELDLEELADSEDVAEEDLYASFSILKQIEEFLDFTKLSSKGDAV